MTCEIVEQDRNQITFKISGTLKRAEFRKAEMSAIELMQSWGKVRFLLIAEDFLGWDSADDWGDMSFQARYDGQIEKIAIIGEKRWQDLAEAFTGKGHRPAEIRYFTPYEAAIARIWIRQDPRKIQNIKED